MELSTILDATTRHWSGRLSDHVARNFALMRKLYPERYGPPPPEPYFWLGASCDDEPEYEDEEGDW